MLIFKGTSTHPVDGDNRFRIPDKFRYDLGQSFIMTRGLGCVCIMRQEDFDTLAEKLYSMGDSFSAHIDPNFAKLQRYLFSGAVTANTDKQNRVTLNPELKKYAGIEKEVVVVGRGNVIEVWNPQQWDLYCQGELTAEKIYESVQALSASEANGGDELPQARSAE